MNYCTKGVVSAFMMLFILYSLLMVNCVFARSSVQEGSRYDRPQVDIDLAGNWTQRVATYSAMAHYYIYNWFGANTTVDAIYDAAGGIGENHSIVFYYGHGWKEDVWHLEVIPWVCQNQWVIIDDDYYYSVYDNWIYSNSGDQNVTFAYIGSCYAGEVIGDPGANNGQWPYGMPNAWLHTNSLSKYGYGNPDGMGKTFIGWNGTSPQLWTDGIGSESYVFGNYFYFYALCCGGSFSVKQALDLAAKATYGQTYTFGSCPLSFGFQPWPLNEHSEIIVYGDGNMHLSGETPSCAMKTKANGSSTGFFYRPNGTNYLKIEKLFSNVNLTGDQTGDDYLYSEISNWPDKQVDVKDVSFVASLFGKNETDSGWKYMADVVPDRKIDTKDTAATARYFGLSGTYTLFPVSSDVAVLFDTGQNETIDLCGFVTIPPGASNFTVTNNGVPIGALIAFW